MVLGISLSCLVASPRNEFAGEMAAGLAFVAIVVGGPVVVLVAWR